MGSTVIAIKQNVHTPFKKETYINTLCTVVCHLSSITIIEHIHAFIKTESWPLLCSPQENVMSNSQHILKAYDGLHDN